MRFIFNKFPDDVHFHPNEGWTPLKESSNLWIVQLHAIPFMIMNVILVIVPMRLMGIHFEIDVAKMFLSFLIFVPVHELLHALFFPENIFSKNVFLGFTLKGFAPFAAYTGEMSRNRFMKVLLAPFLVITFLGFLYLIILGEDELIEHIIVFNALGASGDILGVFLVLQQVPENAIVRNKKTRTYWKMNNNPHNPH